MSVPSWGVYVYSDAGFTTQVDYVAGGAITSSAETYEFTPSAGKTWSEDYYYKVEFVCNNTSTTNGVVCVSKIDFYTKEKVLTGIEVTTLPKTSYYTGDDLDLSGGKITATYDDRSTKDIAMTADGVTVEGYNKDQTGEQTLTVKYCEKETTFNVTVAERPKFTVTFNAGSGSCSTTSLTEATPGAGVELPTASSSGWDFYGWSAASVGDTQTAPAIVGAAGTIYHPTADITLYAVYKKVEGSPEMFVKITSTSEVTTTDEYLLVLDARAKATTNEVSENIWQTASVTIKDNKILASAIGDAKPFKLGLSDGKYSINLSDGCFIKCTSGDKTDISKSNALQGAVYEWEPELRSNSVYLIQKSHNRYLGDNKSGFIKAYKKSNDNPTIYPPAYLYKKTSGTTTTYSTTPPVTLTVSAAGWATFASACKVQIPEDAKVYYIKETDTEEGTTVAKTTRIPAGSVLAAGTGVLVNAAEGTVEFPVSTEEPDALEGTNLLVGVLEPTDKPGEGSSYIFTQKTLDSVPTLGFFPWTSGQLAAGKSFLHLPAGSAVSYIKLFDDEETAIERVTTEQRDETMYDLTGRQVNNAYKGIVIVNGKKILKK
ncbi:MAG: bacterial Ig-like domain-containing protein [Bacteroidaceae bacterium]|nr:bacterial Ig-like domain-containing protein [Bacteroidaceae bacterium]